jgi:two-component system, OmpR family, sensor histidine kinase KdpD
MPGNRPELRDEHPGVWRGLAAAVGAVALATVVIVPLRDVAPDISLGLVYLLAVLAVASRFGRWSGIAAAVLGAAAYNWFLIDPTGQFTVADSRDWYALGVFLVSAVAASALADRARSRFRLVELRRQEAALAAAAAVDLLGEGALRTRLRTAARRVADAVGVEHARIVEGDAAAAEGEVAIELDGPRGRAGSLFMPDTLPQGVQQRLRLRVAPALGTLLESALERDRLAAEVVETEALRRSDALKTALLRATSHDLRSPITAIIAAGETLRSQTLSQADREELADVVVGEGTRLDELIEKLLDLSRLQAGTAEPRADWCEIGELLHAAVEDVEARDPGGGSFTFALQRDLPLVRADPAQLERVFANLMENARRFSAGQPVSVRARVVGSRLVVRIVDQGPGIPPAVQRRVFDPFWRGHDDRRDGHTGSGLGLAIAKGFVEANGGRIALESVPGQGTTVVVELLLSGPVQVAA